LLVVTTDGHGTVLEDAVDIPTVEHVEEVEGIR
jgi:hypothetical protein